MKNRSSHFRLHAGTASILLVFVTLCLISFAVLSLVNATADYRLSKKIAERNTAYYEAITEAEQFIAEAAKQIRFGVAEGEDAPVLEKSFPVSDYQSLVVAVEAVFPADGDDAGGMSYRIVKYQIVTDENALDIPEDTLNLPH